jgi:sec-independent protein translocase protein TatC
MPFIFTELTEAFFIQIESAFIISIICAFCPLVLINLWIYIKPGLFEYEAKAFTWVILILLISISIGFLLGYSKIIPLAWQFFIGFELNIDNLPYSILLEARIKDYIDLLFSFTCLIVLTFQIPCVIGVSLMISLIQIETLIKKRRYIFFFVWLISALITPPDIISQILLAIPLYFFIELGFLLFFMLKENIKGV